MKKKNKPKVNLHKKDDDKGDEESKGYIEKNMEQENNKKMDVLAQNISNIKIVSRSIGTHLNEEKKLTDELDGGFTKTKAMVAEVMGHMDTLLGKASESMCFYIVLFTTLMIALLIKFG